METQRQKQVSSEDNLTISQQRNKRLKKKKNSESIPMDLIIEIISRLPAKSVAKCRCLSKLWASTLRLPYFTELYLARSSSRPQLFFCCHNPRKDVRFFSAPQVTNPSLVTATYLVKFPVNGRPEFRGPLCGLVCLKRIFKGMNETVSVILNPTTRKYVDLPNVENFSRRIRVVPFLGYDPIDKQFKVLSMITGRDEILLEHQVLTLGSMENQWRIIECCIPHDALRLRNCICINGGFYYMARISGACKIIRFDVRYETFRLINNAEDTLHSSIDMTLVNYKGKLGVFLSNVFEGLTKESRCFVLLVLVDAEKHEWSKHVFELPSLWKNVVAEDRLFFVGVTTGTNEIVLAPRFVSERFYVYYYHHERGTIRRVEIQGMKAMQDRIVDTYLDHLERT